MTLTTAATECPTLWYTEGPHGWASGPRAVPLLEMTGRPPALAAGAVSLYLLYGYFTGGYCPFEHVHRVRDRVQIVLEPDEKPLFSTYASLRDYMGNRKGLEWRESVSAAADRIIGRVGNEIIHSRNPVVLLTGGHDSRTLAAAAKKAGVDFITATGGPPDSEDVLVASKVAGILNVEHRLDGEVAGIGLLEKSLERLKLWVRMTEGIIPLNFCLHLKGFLSSELPFPATREQFVHGLEPGIGRGSFYPDVDTGRLKTMTLDEAHGFMAQKNPYLKSSAQADSMLQETFSRLDGALDEVRGNIYHWFELFLWRERGLIWGMDLQSAYGLVRWAWTPLFDRELMRLSWELTVEQKKSGHYLEDVYAYMVPALEHIYCIKYKGMKRKSLAGRVRRRVLFELGRYLNKCGVSLKPAGGSKEAAILSRFWEDTLLNAGKRFWEDFIEEKNLRRIIQRSPGSDVLWRLLSINFLAEQFETKKNAGANMDGVIDKPRDAGYQEVIQ
ncbi:MAG: hypothetical protein M0033_07825 [Nitrospiraceae bacterium]|nr:hypothetical protein [Nitrospiraceae bacterium]